MSVNLYSFVENPFTDKAFFNYDKFKDVVYKAQRLMDDIVDLEEEKINLILQKIENDPEPDEIKAVEKNLWLKILDKLLRGRRTGLSAIGLADCFSSLGITYGTNNSVNLAEEIYKQFAISAYKSSIDMAKERGAFPIWDWNKEKDNPFINRILSNLEKSLHSKTIQDYARRNICLLTIPPSGTISLLAGISSGIEPVYQLYYKRRRKLEKDNPNITFVDQNGDSWEEYTILHPKFKEWIYINTFDWKNLEHFNTYISKLDSKEIERLTLECPYNKSTAYELDPIQRIKLQATIGRFIDHSISSTINLPEDTTEQQVSDIYMTAWKEGCKGITIYRDNCRTGVLVSATKEEVKEFKQYNAPKRPKSLDCEVHYTTVKGEKFAIIVGLLNNKPYELFAISNGKDLLPDKGNGKLIKTSSGQYHITTKNESYFDIVIAMSDEEQIITRLISTALRHGTEVKFIVEQLSKTRGDLTTFGKAISRILKLYIPEKEETKETCPECGSKLIYKDGCKECSRELNSNCTYSKCG
jgi:ribonucleoside-diphosphate reductase alpha chain